LNAQPANELQIAILNLFVDIRVRYPNLIVGKLERDTVKRAMEEGITASQVSYGTSILRPIAAILRISEGVVEKW
jgi:transcription initiation factor TFIIH subunit 4